MLPAIFLKHFDILLAQICRVYHFPGNYKYDVIIEATEGKKACFLKKMYELYHHFRWNWLKK